MAVACLVATGCDSGIETQYGQRKGPGASKSVNGTAVLADMFEEAGHRVYSWPVLSPRLRAQADCIVWFPDDFDPPSPEVRQWMEDWLEGGPGRTLICVGRDFDASGRYWEKVQPGAPPGQLPLIRRESATRKAAFRASRKNVPQSEDCEWFTVENKLRPRKVRTLTGGDPAWRRGIDPSKLEIELNGRIVPQDGAEVLLESQGDVLVAHTSRNGGQLIIVVNGSFLLNAPLVNHEHRKLAAKLIEEAGPPKKTVVFLESGPGGPPITDDPMVATPTGLDILVISPTCWVFLHLAVVGVAFCFSRWPVFGVPRQPDRDSTSDFGKHIQALAELLQRSQDRAYAMTRVLHYQQTIKTGE
jgi:hypothetical protein